MCSLSETGGSRGSSTKREFVMKKIAFAALAAGLIVSFAPAASAATYQQSNDLYAYELGGVGIVTQMEVDRAFAARGVRRPQPTNATRATFRAEPDFTRHTMNPGG
jgi:hypothetical protein